jgi:AcrR family transcriptional regulator
VTELAADELGEALLAAATEVIARGGFEALRVRDVASRAGVALGTPNYKFKSRRGLLIAALARANDLHEEHLASSFEALKKAPARFAGLRFAWARVGFAIERPFETILRAHAVYSNTSEGFREVIGLYADRNLERLASIVTALESEGLVHFEDDPARTFFVRSYSFLGFSYSQSVALAAVSGEPVDELYWRRQFAMAWEALLLGAGRPAELELEPQYSVFMHERSGQSS